MSQTVVLKVGMSCQGCVGAVNRVLAKMEGVESYDINKEEQKVTVIGNVQPDAVFQTVAKTGKKTAFWEATAPAEPETPKETETKPTEAPTEPEAKPAEVLTKTEAKPVEVPTETEAKPAEVPTKTKAKPVEVPTETEAKPAEVPTKTEAKPAETVATA